MGARTPGPFCHSTSFRHFLQSLLIHGPRLILAADFKTRDSAVVARAQRQTPTGSRKMVIPSPDTVVAVYRESQERALLARGVELRDKSVTGPRARESIFA